MITSARSTGEVLDSVSIDKSKLLPVDVVVAKYPKLRVVGKASRLAVKLAKESVFGEEVMRQCTIFGTRQLPGLPREELFQLKKAAFNQFPQFWSHPAQFESVSCQSTRLVSHCVVIIPSQHKESNSI